jgi:hypothetical protein
VDNTALAIPDEMEEYELQATEAVLQFWGTELGRVDNDSGDRPRWAELRLYNMIDTNPSHDGSLSREELEASGDDPDDSGMYGKELWLLYTIGHTLYVHDPEGDCNLGVVQKVRDFSHPGINEDYEDLEACPDCNPAFTSYQDMLDRDPDEEFSIETTWYSYTRCQTPEKVRLALRKEARCRNCLHKPHETWRCSCSCDRYAEAPRPVSGPGKRLLDMVKSRDFRIAMAASAKVRF